MTAAKKPQLSRESIDLLKDILSKQQLVVGDPTFEDVARRVGNAKAELELAAADAVEPDEK